jgi:hypothetical protein
MHKTYSKVRGFGDYFFIGEGDNIICAYLFGEGGGAGYHSYGLQYSYGAGEGANNHGNGTGYGYIESTIHGDGSVDNESLRFDDINA